MEIPPLNGLRLEDVLVAERRRLVGLCAHLTGNVAAAEDLAQETLIEAWRHQHKLHDVPASTPWLSAIARYVCLRWRRAQQRQHGRLALPSDAADTLQSRQESLADDLDVERELERHELVELLDRALALLPSATRTLLIQHYVDEFPQAEMAARLGVTEGTLAVRLHRGKLALRRVLTRNLREDAISYGLVTAESAQWQETRIWCPLCGQRRLLGRFLSATSDLTLRCAACSPVPQTDLYRGDLPAVFHGVRGYRAMLTRMQRFMDRYYAAADPAGEVPCCSCGRPARVGIGLPENAPDVFHGVPGLHVRCHTCEGSNVRSWIRLTLLALGRPEGQRFWRAQARIRALPAREIHFAGRPAILTSFESLRVHARFEVVYARDGYVPLAVCASPHGLEG